MPESELVSSSRNSSVGAGVAETAPVMILQWGKLSPAASHKPRPSLSTTGVNVTPLPRPNTQNKVFRDKNHKI